MREWKECTLADIAQIKKDSWKVGDESSPYIGLEHIEENKLRFNDIGSSEKVGSNKYRFKAGDTLFGKLRPYFRKVIKPDFDGICSTDIWVISPKDGVDADFLFYFFANEEMVNLSYASSSGTRMPRADWDFLKETKWLLPSSYEQKAIASVLSSLDDKIDLLHRQNQTLEAMAETLFRQWFVKEAGDDWEEYKVSDIADRKRETVKPYETSEQLFFHYSLPSFDDGKIPVRELGGEIRSNKYRVIPRSVLVSKLNPRFPRIWAIEKEIDDASICSTEFQVYLPKEDALFPFLYNLLKSEGAINALQMAASGTSGSHQRVKPDDISNITFQVPSLVRAKEFSDVISPLIEKEEENRKQINLLENLRDTLLPKLMSGEIRINTNKRSYGKRGSNTAYISRST